MYKASSGLGKGIAFKPRGWGRMTKHEDSIDSQSLGRARDSWTSCEQWLSSHTQVKETVRKQRLSWELQVNFENQKELPPRISEKDWKVFTDPGNFANVEALGIMFRFYIWNREMVLSLYLVSSLLGKLVKMPVYKYPGQNLRVLIS